MTKRNVKLYVVRGSEDGVIGVANSARKAAAMALNYVHYEEPWTKTQQDILAREVRDNGYCCYDPEGFDIHADVQVFDQNFCSGQWF